MVWKSVENGMTNTCEHARTVEWFTVERIEIVPSTSNHYSFIPHNRRDRIQVKENPFFSFNLHMCHTFLLILFAFHWDFSFHIGSMIFSSMKINVFRLSAPHKERKFNLRCEIDADKGLNGWVNSGLNARKRSIGNCKMYDWFIGFTCSAFNWVSGCKRRRHTNIANQTEWQQRQCNAFLLCAAIDQEPAIFNCFYFQLE